MPNKGWKKHSNDKEIRLSDYSADHICEYFQHEIY